MPPWVSSPSMLPSSRVELLVGPYATPRVRFGDVLFDDARDCKVVVCGLTDARIPWTIATERTLLAVDSRRCDSNRPVE